MTLRQNLNAAAATFATAGVDAPRLSAQVLAAHALRCTKMDLVMRAEQTLTPEEESALQKLVGRRALGEPVAYIVGKKEFYGRDFAVTSATLIPRPETEEMVEKALQECELEHAAFVDLGTGSGCIAVTMAAERPQWRGIMVDISASALAVAEKNATTYGVNGRVLAVRGDLQLPFFPKESLDCVISNPPYVTGAEMAELSPEVRDFEPHSALSPEDTGLAHIAAIAHCAFHLLRTGGICLVEHGYAQGPAVLELFKTGQGWQEACICCDLAGHARYIFCRK